MAFVGMETYAFIFWKTKYLEWMNQVTKNQFLSLYSFIYHRVDMPNQIVTLH